MATITIVSTLLAAGCSSQAPVAPWNALSPGLNPSISAMSRSRAASDLVEAPGFQTGDNLKIDGPLWYDGDGKIYNFTPHAFKVELKVGGYHYLMDATRIDDQKVNFVFSDLKNNVVKQIFATYTRVGTNTTFYLGKGEEVEEFSVNGLRPGYFESVVKQPSQTVKLKVTKG